MPKKTAQQKKASARNGVSGSDSSATASRAYDEVDDRITIPVGPSSSASSLTATATATPPATASSAVLLSGIDKYRNLKGRASSTSASAAPSVDKAAVHASFKSGMVAAVRSSTAASSSSFASPSSPSPLVVKAPPLERAQRLVDQKQHAAAIPFFTEALHSPSVSAQTKLTLLFQRGTSALLAGRFQLAVDDFTYVISLTPSNALLLARRAKAFAALQQYDAALDDYNAAIVMTPPTQAELRRLLLARATVCVHMGNVRQALDDLSTAQHHTHGGDRDPALFYQRAQLYMQRKQPQLALEDLDTFMELQEDWTSSTSSTLSSAVDDDACAPPELEDSDAGRRIVDVRMERATLLLQLAKEADDVRRTDAAVIATEQGEQQPLLSEMPRDYQTSTLSPVRRRQHAHPSKTTDHPKKKKISSWDTMGYRGADAIAFVERAVDDYTQILKTDPAHSEALRLRGESLAKIGRPQDALRDLDAALVVDPHDYHVQIARAKLLFAMQEMPQAIDEMTRVLQRTGFFVDALFLRAEMYAATEEYDKAKSDYTSIVHAELETKSAGSPSSESLSLHTTASNGKVELKKGLATSGGGGGGGKITNEYSVQALLLRARLCQQLDDFDGAAADYKRILESFPNHMEAQYELQENDEKRDAFEKQRELDAIAWLVEEEKRREHGGVAASSGGGGSGTAGVVGGGAAVGTGKPRKKKKAKKKKTGTGTTPTASETAEAETEADATATGDEEDTEKNAVSGETEQKESTLRIETSDSSSGRQSPTSAGRRRPMASPTKDVSAAELTKKKSSVSIVVTRDEACESMWEDHPDELELSLKLRKRGKNPLESADFYPLRIHSDDDDKQQHQPSQEDNALRIAHAPAAANSEDEEPDVEEPTPLESLQAHDEQEDALEKQGEQDPTDTKASTPSHVAIRERLVDEKYLKKRQKQLDKLRVQLREACEARDRDVIEETMARVERKQMNESLEGELAEATRVLQAMAADAKRSDDEHKKQERYRQQELERERRRIKQREDEEEKQRQQAKVKEMEAAKGAVPSDPVVANNFTAVVDMPASVTSAEDRSGGGGDMKKPTTPSLVIRPIAYGHALHLAEQHQQQLLQYQRLLHEKDAEIAFLRNLLETQQSASQAAVTNAVDEQRYGTSAVAKLLLRPHTASDAVLRKLDLLIECMSPSAEADEARFRILSFVRRVLARHWSSAMGMNLNMAPPLVFVATGSFPMKTYLPTADLDVTLFLPKELEPSWHFAVLNALCMAGTSGTEDGTGTGALGGGGAILTGSPDGKTAPVAAAASSASGMSSHTVRNVTLINAEVRVVKCTIDNVSVDLTANRVGALGALLLLDAMDLRVGRDHLLKRSLVLIKSWCVYESSAFASGSTNNATNSGQGSGVLGASTGGLTTYAINTIVMSLFNQHASSITHPLQALLLFLDRMAEFPWHESALTLFGAVPLGILATSGSLAVALDKLGQKPNGSGARGRTQSDRTAMNDSMGPSMAVLTLDDVDQIRRHVHEQFGALDPSFSPPVSTGSNGSTASGSTTPVGIGAGTSPFKSPSFPIRACNVVDPLDDQNNLARSVSLELFPSMKRVFTLGRNRLAKVLLTAKPLSEEESMDAFFATCWKTYGRGNGWRPDLLVHPRQTWHARAGKDLFEYEHKWQSLLPEFLMAPSPLGPFEYAAELDPSYAPQYPIPHHHSNASSRHHHHDHHYAHPQQHQQSPMNGGGDGGMGNGSSSMNGHGHMHHFQPSHGHNNSPGHYGSHRSSGSAGSNRNGGGYDDRMRASPTTNAPAAFKSSPRRALSLPGAGSTAAAQMVAVAAAVSASSPTVNGNRYPASAGSGVYDENYQASSRPSGSHGKGSRRYDSPTTTKHAAAQSTSK